MELANGVPVKTDRSEHFMLPEKANKAGAAGQRKDWTVMVRSGELRSGRRGKPVLGEASIGTARQACWGTSRPG